MGRSLLFKRTKMVFHNTYTRLSAHSKDGAREARA